jgi:hypothetical protein
VSAGTCAYCGGPAEGNYSIHRDGFGEGPEVDLCDAHGGQPEPGLGEVWERIAERLAAGATFTENAGCS